MNVKDLEERYELPVYPIRDIVLVRGKAAKLYDEEGREYIDCASNVGVSNIGHADESVAKAIYEQYLTFGNCYGMFYNPVRARLAERLISLAPGFFRTGQRRSCTASATVSVTAHTSAIS